MSELKELMPWSVSYLREMEGRVGYRGWETFLQPSYRKGSKPFLSTGVVIWVCILLMSVIVPILFGCFGFAAPTGLPHQP
jgi:hypothetical protein